MILPYWQYTARLNSSEEDEADITEAVRGAKEAARMPSGTGAIGLLSRYERLARD